jgi:ferredoxin
MGWTLNRDKCLTCGACVAVCPFAALELESFPENDLKKCTLCGTGEKVCPVSAIKVSK